MKIKHVILGICMVVAGYVWGHYSVEMSAPLMVSDSTIYINNHGEMISMPEEFPIATEEDLLSIETVEDGVTYIGFKHLN